MSKRFIFLVFLGSLCLSFLLYWNTLRGEFVYDDVFFTKPLELGEASYLPKLWFESVLPNSPQANLYRPFTMFTFSLNLIAHGKTPLGFHLVSIVLNGAVTFLVFLLVFKLFENRTLALFTALFFAFLPIHTEAVAFMKARDELLSAFFALLSWLAFLRARTAQNNLHLGWLFASALFFFIGLLSKEFVVVIPALFFLVYWIQHGIKPLSSRLFDFGAGVLLYGGFFAVYLWMRSIALPEGLFGNDDIGPISNVLIMVPKLERTLTAFKIAYLYMTKMFVPIGLTASYHFKAVTLVLDIFYSWRAMVGLAFLGTFLFLSVWKKTRATALGVGALSFLILYFPSSQLILQGGDIMGERWMYLPSLGIAMIVGWFFTWIFKYSKATAIILFLAVVIWYATVLIPRNLVWRTPLSLFESMLRDSPKSVKGYSTLAQYYFEHGQYVKAREMVDRGLAITIQEPNLYVVAASIAYEQKEYPLAEELIKRALSLDTFSSAAVLNYPRILFSQGKYEEALLWFDGFITQLPESSLGKEDRLLYATLLTKMEMYYRSDIYIDTYLGSELDTHDVKLLLSVNLYRIGKKEEAVRNFGDYTKKSDEEIAVLLEKF